MILEIQKYCRFVNPGSAGVPERCDVAVADTAGGPPIIILSEFAKLVRVRRVFDAAASALPDEAVPQESRTLWRIGTHIFDLSSMRRT